MTTLRPITLKLGDRVESIRARIFGMPDGKRIEPGDIGEVIKVHKPERGTGLMIDDVRDDGCDGCAVIHWPNWGRALVWPDDEGKTWRKV